jgi:hypothetical protein
MTVTREVLMEKIKPDDVVVERIESEGLRKFILTIKNPNISKVVFESELGEPVPTGVPSWEACKWEKSHTDWEKCTSG